MLIAAIETTHALFGLGAATTAAACWACSVVLYRRIGRVLPPVRMNLAKNLLATGLLGVLLGGMWAVGGAEAGVGGLFALPAGLMGLLILSGVVGIGIGDSCLFAALARLGARRALLLFMFAPVAAAGLGWPILGEPVGLWQAAGILITVGGIGWVIAERNHATSDGHVDALGVVLALIAALCQAGGALMSRYVFAHSDIAAAPTAIVRIVGGTAVLLFMLPLDRLLPDAGGSDDNHPQRPGVKHTWLMLGGATFVGTFLGIWLQQIAFKSDAPVGVAQTMLSTSPLFVLPIVALLGERVSWRAVCGAAVSVVGVAVLFLRSAG